MILCEQCPNNPDCQKCLDALRSGSSARKVIPPRPVRVTLLGSNESGQVSLVTVSRTAIGLYSPNLRLHDRIEVELASDFRIIGTGLRGIEGDPFYVLDIDKVLRRQEVLDRLLIDEFHTWLMSGELDLSNILVDRRDRDDERSRLIKQELQKLSILRQVETIFLYHFEAGNLRSLGSSRAEPDVEREMRRLVSEAASNGASLREQLVSANGEKVFELYASPLPDQTCGIALIDVTAVITEEKRRKKREWELYRDLMGVVTKNKLLLLSDEELFFLLREGRKLLSIDLHAPEDLAELRFAFRRALEPMKIPDKRLLQYMVAVNEAASNTIKHGNGGTVTLYALSDWTKCRTVIHDQGQGIVLEDLPRATLLQGYSTQQSLGVGFHVMLQYCDRLFLGSSHAGTKLILECGTHP